ncbi:ATP-binding protein [Raoultella ornithinolytica]|uniref:ATP-binding protein n=1 Tax=Raoultella ornithinolytica TaxID=54291 RepID=UPI000FEB7A9C|nr:ATP-binding protein [Raoultella ornithinolytica]EJG2381582.1 HAMP domain-containing protein [Raoultella ornithinolytica]EKV0508354.1 HAMP domain-containing protein [Raoultella ornithinolytica]EMF1899520.1 HAMP domain-containing protein [Raoultella ornithinolytica]RWT03230.1 two-component sensor histidine kinase [Raoultella ornithinolytica]HAT2179744.1 HAMP domain-containing protein [Raoultella ornithinolytica]
MRLWPASLRSRLMLMIFFTLLLANALTLSLLLYERMSSARSVMLGNLEYDVATSVAILDRLPAAERPQWLARLARGNYRYRLSTGVSGHYPDSWRSRDAVRSLQEALSGSYPVSIIAVPGPREHIQAHITLHDGAPLSIDLWPRLPAIARWLPAVLIVQFLLLLACAWYAVRQVVRPMTRFTRAIDALQPANSAPGMMAEQGPVEVQHAARAFNAMQTRIRDHLQERARILAAISHDLQTPITRMKLRLEMTDAPELRDKLLQDLDNMSRLVREGIAFARSAQPLEEKRQRLDLNAFLDSIALDYADVGRPVAFIPAEEGRVVLTQPQALRRIMTNLIDNGLKFAERVDIRLSYAMNGDPIIQVMDNGPGIPEASLEEVLQPFFRLENSRNRETGGTGLGLAIAAQLTSQMPGTLRLGNRPEGGLEAIIRLDSAVLYPSVSRAETDNLTDKNP